MRVSIIIDSTKWTFSVLHTWTDFIDWENTLLKEKFLQTSLRSNYTFGPQQYLKMLSRKRKFLPDGLFFNYEKLFTQYNSPPETNVSLAQHAHSFCLAFLFFRRNQVQFIIYEKLSFGNSTRRFSLA